MSEQKYIRVEDLKTELYEIPISPKSKDKIFSLPTYTNAEILGGMWVPVSERLPKIGKKVLVCWTANGELCMDTAFRLRDSWAAAHWEIAADVTHWMPLPEPPKEV